jgi:hypothetical protein
MPATGEACAQNREVKVAAVKAYPPFRVLHLLCEEIEHGIFVVVVTHEILAQAELLSLKGAEPDHEGVGSRACAEACCLDVQKDGRAEIQGCETFITC